MIVTIFTMLFPPDMGGGATRALNIAKCLANQGHEVRVITSLPNYPEGSSLVRSFRPKRESTDGITVVRLPACGLPHRGLLNRVIIYCWFAAVSIFALGTCKGSRRIISLGPHPFTELPTYIAKIATDSVLIVDISDLWPETYRLENKLADALFQGAGFCFNRIVFGYLCDRISVYNERALDSILRRYDFKKQHAIIYNSVDTGAFRYQVRLKTRKEKLRTILGRSVRGRFVVLYHGVIGPYQRLENIVKAASIEENELKKALFVMIGDGEKKRSVVEYADSIRNHNVIFLPKMDRTQIENVVAESDLGLVPIASSDDFTRRVSMPLKATEFLACGTPVLVPKDSFIGKIVTEHQAGFEVDFSDPLSIFGSIKKAFDDRATYELMARQARQVAVSYFSLDRISESIRGIIA